MATATHVYKRTRITLNGLYSLFRIPSRLNRESGTIILYLPGQEISAAARDVSLMGISAILESL